MTEYGDALDLWTISEIQEECMKVEKRLKEIILSGGGDLTSEFHPPDEWHGEYFLYIRKHFELRTELEKRGAWSHWDHGRSEQARNRMTWLGTHREFADWILKARVDGKLKAENPTDALKQGAEHFVDKDGKQFDPHSLYVNLRNRDEYNDTNKPGTR